MNKTEISDEEFERRFDAGEDISEFVDWKNACRPGRKLQRVNINFPSWMVNAIDREAYRLGVSRQALVKFVMDRHLQNVGTEHVQGLTFSDIPTQPM
jgi:hypothetical protein